MTVEFDILRYTSNNKNSNKSNLMYDLIKVIRSGTKQELTMFSAILSTLYDRGIISKDVCDVFTVMVNVTIEDFWG